MASTVSIPQIADEDKTPIVNELLTIIQSQKITIKQLKYATGKSGKTEIEDPARLNIYNVLKEKRSFGQMPDEMLRRLVKSMKVLRKKKGEDVLTQGEPTAFVFIMLRGRVSVLVDEQLVYTFNRIGDIFGELSYINQTVCSATIRAETDLELIAISQKNLRHIGNEDFFLWLCRILSDKLTRTTTQLNQANNPTQPTDEDSEKPATDQPTEEATPAQTETPNPEEASPAESEETAEKPQSPPKKEEAEELFEEEAVDLDNIPTNPDDFFAPE